jgi:hypothetical protein
MAIARNAATVPAIHAPAPRVGGTQRGACPVSHNEARERGGALKRPRAALDHASPAAEAEDAHAHAQHGRPVKRRSGSRGPSHPVSHAFKTTAFEVQVVIQRADRDSSIVVRQCAVKRLIDLIAAVDEEERPQKKQLREPGTQ